jgi:hypothetical protein
VKRFNKKLKPIKKCFSLALLGIVSLFCVSSPAIAQDDISSFAVLSVAFDSGGAVYCTSSTVDGSIGTSGGEILRNGCSLNGESTQEISEEVLIDFDNSQIELSTVYCDQTLTGSMDGLTLQPGVYCFDSAATLSGSLTLSGPSDGSWIFKIGSLGEAALTATNFSVTMAVGPGNKCNVWWVADSVTLTSSQVIGHFLSNGPITITGGTLYGQALAKAAVTLTGVTTTSCNSIAPEL